MDYWVLSVDLHIRSEAIARRYYLKRCSFLRNFAKFTGVKVSFLIELRRSRNQNTCVGVSFYCYVMLRYTMWNLFTVGSLQFRNDSAIASLEANQNRQR